MAVRFAVRFTVSPLVPGAGSELVFPSSVKSAERPPLVLAASALGRRAPPRASFDLRFFTPLTTPA